MKDIVTDIKFLDARKAIESLDSPDLLKIEELSKANQKLVEERLRSGVFVDPIPSVKNLPYGTKVIDNTSTHVTYRAFRERSVPMLVMAGLAIYDDLTWYHVSFSRSDRLPSYHERAWVKQHWIGDERWAIDVLPSKNLHVNYHPYCLHLWHCIERPNFLPNFNIEGHV